MWQPISLTPDMPQINLPIIHTLCNPGLRQRHWEKMSEVAGFNITPDSGTSLRKMLKHNLEPFMDEFESISAGASKEHSLEKAMQRMVDDWEPIVFSTTLYRDTGLLIARDLPYMYSVCVSLQVCPFSLLLTTYRPTWTTRSLRPRQ